MKFKLQLISAAALTLALTACGGGGSSDPAAPIPTNGTAVDGHLFGASVLCDVDGHGFASPPSINAVVTTVAGGKFTFPQGCSHDLIVRGGRSEDTQLPLVGLLKAPAGATVISPLTTLLAGSLTQTQLRTALGLSGVDLSGVDLLNTDPADGNHASLFQKTLAVQQLLQKTTELIVGLANDSAASEAVYTEVARAFATKLAGGGIALGSTLQAADVSALIQAALTGVMGSAQVSGSGVTPAVAMALANAGGAPVLAFIAKDAMTAQAQAILDAAANQISAVAKIQQADPAITAALQSARSTSALSANSKTTDEAVKGLVTQLAEHTSTATTTTSTTTSTSAPTTSTTSSSSAATTTTTTTSTTTTTLPVSSNYLYLAGNAISFDDGYLTTPYSLAQFQSKPGISVKWPMYDSAAIKFTLTDAGSFSVATGQTLSAAVSIVDTATNSQGTVKFYIDNVAVSKSGSNINLAVPSAPVAWAFGILPDGSGAQLTNFSSTVANAAVTLSTAPNTESTIAFGSALNSALKGAGSLSGTYKVTLVITNLPLSLANGSPFNSYTIEVPKSLGDMSIVRSITGPGLEGYITLVPR